MTQKENWLKNYNLVRKYYEENGDLLVPYKYEVKDEEGSIIKLGAWISTQRKFYKKNKLQDWKIKLLEEIEMVWTVENIEQLGKESRKKTNDKKWLKNYNLAKKYYEENARCILTVWGQKDTQLNDYANRGWGGLTRTFYRERWKRFTEEVIAAMTRHKNFDEEKFHQDITQFEYEWTLKNEDFPITSGENPISLAKELILKYDDDFHSLYP